jgi:hypothetical protein
VIAGQSDSSHSQHVMAGLVPAIHAGTFCLLPKVSRKRRGLDGLDKPGHDGGGFPANGPTAPLQIQRVV